MINLSKIEMKKIMAGKAGDGGTCATTCYAWDDAKAAMVSMTCGYVPGVGGLPGFCSCPKGTGSSN